MSDSVTQTEETLQSSSKNDMSQKRDDAYDLYRSANHTGLHAITFGF
jgi:hypothetical protein